MINLSLCVQIATPTQRVWLCNYLYLYQYIDNSVADTISRLDCKLALTSLDDKDISKETKWNNFPMLLNHYKKERVIKRIASTIVITIAKYSPIIKVMTKFIY